MHWAEIRDQLQLTVTTAIDAAEVSIDYTSIIVLQTFIPPVFCSFKRTGSESLLRKYIFIQLGAVAHACHPSTLGG